jgi:hypothetical protein
VIILKMPAKNKRKDAVDSSETGEYPREEGSEYEQGRQEAIEEAEENRIVGEKEAVEERLREDELRHGHAHTPYFGFDNPSYEVKETFKGGSSSDKKKQKRK